VLRGYWYPAHCPGAGRLFSRYAEIRIDLTITDRWVDLAEKGYDAAIRVTGDPPPNGVARKLAPVRRKLCATPMCFEFRQKTDSICSA